MCLWRMRLAPLAARCGAASSRRRGSGERRTGTAVGPASDAFALVVLARQRPRRSGGGFEGFETSDAAVPDGPILISSREVKRAFSQPLERFEHRTVGLPKQPLRNVDPVARIYADEVRVERGVVDL